MTTYVALLRGINVGGHKKVPMAALRELLTELGHGDVRTLLQSGNAVFTSAEKNRAKLVAGLEQALADRFGFEVRCIVLDTAELRAVADRNPFPPGSFEPSKLVVIFLTGPVDPGKLSGLDPEAYLPDEFHPGEREIYVHCPNGLGTSKLMPALGKVRLGVEGTARNWNTVTKLLAMMEN
ncbi:DUF1697 domain-containing protein [Streptomyces sp. NPDC004647]|uniref:DUF1697 domain-containing protein n=1 Tax=Streptomyces sp. NPDC004647 TaxID=3154671 RepID=UPI0033A18105